MRFLSISLFYFGLPFWVTVRSPLNVGATEVAMQFAQFVAVQTAIVVLFLIGAIILGRVLFGNWVWQEDTVVLHRRSNHATTGHVAYVPKTTSQLLHEYWQSEEGQAEYITWLSHK